MWSLRLICCMPTQSTATYKHANRKTNVRIKEYSAHNKKLSIFRFSKVHWGIIKQKKKTNLDSNFQIQIKTDQPRRDPLVLVM